MTTKNEHPESYVVFETTWKCAEPSCQAPGAVVEAVRARVAHGTRTCYPPPGWTEIDGRTYCPRHQVHVTVLVHTRMNEGADCGSIGQNSTPKGMFEEAFPGKEYRR